MIEEKRNEKRREILIYIIELTSWRSKYTKYSLAELAMPERTEPTRTSLINFQTSQLNSPTQNVVFFYKR